MKYLLLDRRDEIAFLILNQPDVRNRFSAAVITELHDALSSLESDAGLRALIITGAGTAFAAGADISEMARMSPAEAIEFSRLGQTAFDRVERLRAITIAAVNGPAVGGGCELALACDYRIASDKARLGQVEVAVGLIPGWGGARRMTRLVGYRCARDLILSGRLVTAAEALQIGLVDHVAPGDELMSAAEARCRDLLKKSPLILGYAKASLAAAAELSGEAAAAEERRLFGQCFESQDTREGLTAFLEKREAVFRGR